jgi:transcriptional regulator with XRE-family HTH domain
MTREEWRAEAMRQFGGAVAEARKRAGMSQQELADRIGSSRNAIQNLEAMKGRTSSFNVLDLIEIAATLGIPPLQLLYPALPDGSLELLPGMKCTSLQAAQWFSGEVSSDQLPDTLPALDTRRTVKARRLQELRREIEVQRNVLLDKDASESARGVATKVLPPFEEQQRAVVQEMRQEGWPVDGR